MQDNITLLDSMLLNPNTLYKGYRLYFKVINAIVKNWYDIILFRAGIKNRINLELRSGKKIPISNTKEYADFFLSDDWKMELLDYYKRKGLIKIKNNAIEFTYKGKKLLFYHDNKNQLLNSIFLIIENFINEQYSWLDIKGNTVIDVGANIADSAIFFAANGAQKVYAFEPYPYSCYVGNKNIQLNKFSNKISLLNAGCGIKNTSVRINENYKNLTNDQIKQSKHGKKVEILTLEKIVNKYKIRDAILKMDCEGEEYDILLHTDNKILRNFKEMIIEYHHGYLNLEKKLRSCGFDVRHTRPRRVYINLNEQKVIAGTIFVKR